MLYTDRASIDFLKTQLDRDKGVTSSHWEKYHRGFSVNADGTISGIQGFGGSTKPYSGWKKIIHSFLQRRFRKMAISFPTFANCDAAARDIVTTQDRAYDLDVLRQSITLAFLQKHLPADRRNVLAVVIGDGFGSMTSLLLASRYAKQVVLVNLSKTLLVDLIYLKRWADQHPGIRIALATSKSGFQKAIKQKVSVIALQASNHELLKDVPADLVVNIASMQEMDPPIIAGYFKDIRSIAARRSVYFYCCNREEKTLPDGGVIRFSEYPWKSKDRLIVDELCPWHQSYYSKSPPFYHPYDGPVRHRLAKMSA